MDRIKYLILAFLREEITPDQQSELDAWLEENPTGEQLLAELQDPARVAEALAKLDQLHRQEAWEKVEWYANTVRAAGSRVEGNGGKVARVGGRLRRLYWTRLGIAAACAGLLGVGIWWLASTKQTEPKSAAVASKPADIPAPATNKAKIGRASCRERV